MATPRSTGSTIFGVAWSELTLERVDAFLTDADSEPLLWEAKGRNPKDPSKHLDRHDLRKEICAFANHHETGYVILGASEANAGWQLDGVSIPNDDPPAWLHDVAEGGLRPVPEIAVKPWKLGDGSWVAVARVPPVDTPPCNSRGTVYERVAGKSIPVRDPQRLAQLYARGEAAHESAQAAARAAARSEFLDAHDHPFRQPEHVQEVVLGIGTTGTADDIASLVFTSSTETALQRTLTELVPAPPAASAGADVSWHQDHLAGASHYFGRHAGYAATAGIWWDGSVSIFLMTGWDAVDIDQFAHNHLARVWSDADRLVRLIGGHGDYYVTVLASGGKAFWPVRPTLMLSSYVGAAQVDVGPSRAEDRDALLGRSRASSSVLRVSAHPSRSKPPPRAAGRRRNPE